MRAKCGKVKEQGITLHVIDELVFCDYPQKRFGQDFTHFKYTNICMNPYVPLWNLDTTKHDQQKLYKKMCQEEMEHCTKPLQWYLPMKQW